MGLLTMGDAYYEEHMGAVMDSMLPQVHMLGEGIIGQTAFTGKHRWMHSDAPSGEWSSCNSLESQDMFQDDSELRCQFSSGIKTIATISVEPRGVIQFGSTKKIMERSEVLDETRRLFWEMESLDGLIPLENVPSCLNNGTNDLNELFASLISSGNSYNGDVTWTLGDKFKELRGNDTSAMNLTSEIRVQDSHESCRNTAQNIQMESTFTSLADLAKPIQGSCGYQMDNQHSLHGFPVEFNPTDFTTNISKFCQVDDLSQWFAASPEENINGMATTLNDDLSQVMESTSGSSGLVKGDRFIDAPIEHPDNSMHSSITNPFNAGGHENSVFIQNAENGLFDGLGPDFGCDQVGECWEDIMVPAASGGYLNTGTALTKCFSEPEVGSMTAPRKGLFSELGLEELLNGISTTTSSVFKSSLEDLSSTTRKRKSECSSVNSNQVQFARLAGSSGSMHSTEPLYNLDKTNSLVPKKDFFPKSQVGLWIDDSYSVNARSAAQDKQQQAEEHTKTTRKRARPGESTRPRPKDRQQIQDRMKELRGIIPVVASIDSLLDRTIKYMLFLQSVTKYADKLKQAHEPKLIGKENGVVLKDNNNRSAGNTWALAVEGQTVVCPIIVEDLSPPGQMLIEMLCEEQGFFLEIADIIRGFGLNILKGVMESREDKIWARFIVEANRHVTRIDVFWSLLRLLQQTTNNVVDPTNLPTNIVDSGVPILDSCQQQSLPPPISLS
ncbi:Serine/threonine-protein kinase With No Lysine-related protein [Prunus dulcis]|uniref:Serine/threonine-protein kinase With No Lysine-related protein n=1 Tax=Prunus dulcis TaxID=3755 RepID=A0A4Y1RHQ1_PRUDU|nr:Serine/threonine-protein kinase With No Lysine-related protein [Prunus dulcis]